MFRHSGYRFAAKNMRQLIIAASLDAIARDMLRIGRNDEVARPRQSFARLYPVCRAAIC
jgi:hypothetical protein